MESSKLTKYDHQFHTSVTDPECAGGGGVSHILAEKGGVGFTLLKKMNENSIFSLITGGRTPGTPYAGSATVL